MVQRVDNTAFIKRFMPVIEVIVFGVKAPLASGEDLKGEVSGRK
jgi:hypothetical protein